MSLGQRLQIPGEGRSPHSDHSRADCWEEEDQEQMLIMFREFGFLFSDFLVVLCGKRVWLKQHLWGISLFCQGV